jgi:NhaP-type Na+/H+ or K+/H+ antiporter
MYDSYITREPVKLKRRMFCRIRRFIVFALGGTAFGIDWGFLAGSTTKFTHRVPVIEPVVVFIMSYGASINAEAFQVSGIFSHVSFPFLLIFHVTVILHSLFKN